MLQLSSLKRSYSQRRHLGLVRILLYCLGRQLSKIQSRAKATPVKCDASGCNSFTCFYHLSLQILKIGVALEYAIDDQKYNSLCGSRTLVKSHQNAMSTFMSRYSELLYRKAMWVVSLTTYQQEGILSYWQQPTHQTLPSINGCLSRLSFK